ncbi:two-component system sensor histidine kinase KdpD [Paenibacillus phyllosphaerae]|uniref:histidine kinase n=1 Tax=Paenibacillus phyllosphaerae TaxID=274593 RepID=A0A7W5FP22_9BACL|nr:ATP-binding protein [Paenibacillus phyllosphaerae]MBB3111599.1 two-component system sensor histidine kinase KdpD [Paenibacillus phyllosphaerae]
MKQQRAYLWVTLSIILLTIALKLFGPSIDLVNIALVYLLPVLLSAVYGGKGPSLFAAGLGVLIFDFFFVPPHLSFSVTDLRYLVSFAIFLFVAALTGSLASKLKLQLEYSKQREAHTASLYALSKEMNAFADLEPLLRHTCFQVSSSVQSEAVIYLPSGQGELALAASSSIPPIWGMNESETVIARWVYSQGERAGKGANTLREASGLYIPLRIEEKTYGVLGVHLGAAAPNPETLRLLNALGEIAASAIGRLKLGEEAKLVHLTAESERLRTAILDSVSHELRTPLATVIGSATALIENDDLFGREDRTELLSTIRDGALRMNRLVSNLLGMVQLESGMLTLRKKWCDVEDMIGVVLKQVEDFRQQRVIRVRLPEHVPLILGDEVLLEQVLVNVVSNAIKYSPDRSEITMLVDEEEEAILISIHDQGIGIGPADRERIFDKFYRAESSKHVPGTGLGLAICRGIIELHGGTIAAGSNNDKGTVITISLPLHDDHRSRAVHAEGGMELP